MALIENFEFFNNELKRNFLSNCSPRNTEIYCSLFYRSKEIELIKNKDIKDFSINDLEDYFKSLHCSNQITIKRYTKLIKNYIVYFNGKCEFNLGKSWYANLIDESNCAILTNDDLRKIEETCVNFQDIALVLLIFEGVLGENCCELKDLTINDVNFYNNTIILKGKNRLRTIIVSDRCLEIIKLAYAQDEHITTSNRKIKLVRNEYILRPTIQNNGYANRSEQINKHIVSNRLKTISELLNIEKLTPKVIQQSGMLKYANDLIKGNSILDKNVLLRICDKFDFNKDEYRNIRAYVNNEKLEEYYDLNNISNLSLRNNKNKNYFKINGKIATQNNMTYNTFTESFKEWVEQHGWYFVGKINKSINVKIIKASSNLYWYSNYIGETFIVRNKKQGEHFDYYVIQKGKENYGIMKDDVIISD